MKNKQKHTFAGLCLFSALALSGTALADNTDRDRDDRSQARGSLASPDDAAPQEALIEKATAVYRNVVKGPQGEVPASVIQSARCVAIVPNAVTAAVGIGGMSGNGVGFCKKNNAWAGPVFLDLVAGSVGAQAGIKSADLVIFLSGENAERAMLDDGFKFGGELSGVAGSYDKSFTIPKSGVVIYSDTSGVFAGASLSEGSLSRDEKRNREFYGTDYDKSKLFSMKGTHETQSLAELKMMLPKAG